MIYVRILAWRNKFEKDKVYRKDLNKELMLVAQQQTSWQKWCMPEYVKKKECNQFSLMKIIKKFKSCKSQWNG